MTVAPGEGEGSRKTAPEPTESFSLRGLVGSGATKEELAVLILVPLVAVILIAVAVYLFVVRSHHADTDVQPIRATASTQGYGMPLPVSPRLHEERVTDVIPRSPIPRALLSQPADRFEEWS
jgi:hypothetical protein